jgi:hypothetical protein
MQARNGAQSSSTRHSASTGDGATTEQWLLYCVVSCKMLTQDAGDKAVAAAGRVAGALRLVGRPPAGGTLRTRLGAADWGAGLAGEVAGLVVPTVIVGPAFHVDTCDERVALQACGTDAPRPVELHQALSPAAAGLVRIQAGIQAVLVDTGLVHGAVVVHPALRPVALAVRVAPVALRTSANRVVHTSRALRLWCARVLHDAGVDAVLVDAGLVHGALRVCRAFSLRLDCKQGGDTVCNMLWC